MTTCPIYGQAVDQTCLLSEAAPTSRDSPNTNRLSAQSLHPI